VGISHDAGAHNESMANANAAEMNFNALYHNPAGMAFTENTVLISSFQTPFLLKDLKSGTIGLVLPTNSGVFGFSLQHLGISGFAEENISLTFSKKFSSKFTGGIRLNNHILNVNEYGSNYFFTFDIGINTFIINDLNIGFFIQNPISRKLNETDRTPSVFRLGLAYSISEKIKTYLETEKSLLYPVNLKFGFEYFAADKITLRCGFNTYPTKFSFGIGFLMTSNWQIDCALSSHSTLGMTPAVGLIYKMKKKK
jgi:hypothetical protein